MAFGLAASAGAALGRAIGVKTPIYRLMFSEALAFGFPPKPYAFSAQLALLEEEAGPAPWMIAGVCVDVRPLIGEAVARCGHVRVGPEDIPLSSPMNKGRTQETEFKARWVPLLPRESAKKTFNVDGRSLPERHALFPRTIDALACVKFRFVSSPPLGVWRAGE